MFEQSHLVTLLDELATQSRLLRMYKMEKHDNRDTAEYAWDVKQFDKRIDDLTAQINAAQDMQDFSNIAVIPEMSTEELMKAYPNGFVVIYQALYGYKAQYVTPEEVLPGQYMFTPWDTSYYQYPTWKQAVPSALDYAAGCEVPLLLTTTQAEEVKQ